MDSHESKQALEIIQGVIDATLEAEENRHTDTIAYLNTFNLNKKHEIFQGLLNYFPEVQSIIDDAVPKEQRRHDAFLSKLAKKHNTLKELAARYRPEDVMRYVTSQAFDDIHDRAGEEENGKEVVNQKDQDLEDEGKLLDEKQKALENRKKDLNEEEKDFEHTQQGLGKHLEDKAQILNQKEESLDQQEAGLKWKEQILKQEAKNLDQQEEELEEKDDVLKTRDGDLKKKDEVLKKVEKDLKKKEKDLEQARQTLEAERQSFTSTSRATRTS